MRDRKVATVIGVGPGLGAALTRRFAADYAVAMVARNAEKLNELGREISASPWSPLRLVRSKRSLTRSSESAASWVIRPLALQCRNASSRHGDGHKTKYL
jgi:NAD(P)-dependent dehydrogenase (short-subunit alcohol dehydrogenase family)